MGWPCIRYKARGGLVSDRRPWPYNRGNTVHLKHKLMVLKSLYNPVPEVNIIITIYFTTKMLHIFTQMKFKRLWNWT